MYEQLLPTEPGDYRVMYVDMNSFFASVEQQENPGLRGRPVGVAACLGNNCTIIAASVEAKRLGISTGTRVGEARQRCPDIAIVRDRAQLYRDYHSRIMGILRDTYCKIGVKSIDEAYLIIPSYAQTEEACITLATGIKSEFQAKLGEHLSCSIGIAPTIWLAKMAANLKKPNGLYIVTLADLSEFLSQHKLTDCTGIGRRLARKFYSCAVMSVSDLAMRSLPFMRRKFGVVGEKWYLRLRGYEVDSTTSSSTSHKLSISHQVTITGDRHLGADKCSEYMAKLSYKLGSRLRADRLFARGIALYAVFSDQPGRYTYLPARHSFSTHGQIYRYALDLLTKLNLGDAEIRLFALTLTGLSGFEQLELGLDGGIPNQEEQLATAIELINARYGTEAIALARGWATDIMPDRVGFGRL